ncbi:MAG: biopolymer transporter ExbD [Hyphomicrobiales bacterium]|uniref:ExbD/TolR family protein n=1 Tax=Shimia thalassica TaxID=1715693 RepID=UPI003298A623
MEFTDAKPFRRKPSLTPMIDVVFLLLVFFMLASRFGLDQVLPMPLASSGGDFSGPPKLIDIYPESIRLNGIERSAEDLPTALNELVETPADAIILRSSDGADVQRIVTVSEILRKAGFTTLVLVE